MHEDANETFQSSARGSASGTSALSPSRFITCCAAPWRWGAPLTKSDSAKRLQRMTPAGAQIGALGIRIPTGAAHTYTTLPALAK